MPAADFAALTSLAAAAEALETARDEVLAQARLEIEAWRAEAKAEVEAELARAQAERERGYQEGFDKGREDAATRWIETALRSASLAQANLARQTERLSSIVSLAVERVIEEQDRGALYRRAVIAVTKMIKDVPLLTLRVSAADGDVARQAVAELAAHGDELPPIEVVQDAMLAEGSCLFESDEGVVDAGLSTQLAAVRRAVARSAHLAASAIVQADHDASLDATGLRGSLLQGVGASVQLEEAATSP